MASTRLLRALTLCAISGLVACDAGSGSDALATVDAAGGNVALAVPPMLSVRAINADNLVPRVVINGEVVDAREIDGEWQASLVVPQGSDLDMQIIWIERVDFRELRLAEAVASVTSIDSDSVIRVFAGDYEVDSFDADFDGISNLAERIGESDPFDVLSPGSDFAQVEIPFIDPAGAPDIDGIEDAVWAGAAVRDQDRDLLRINNLMIDQGATRLDGDTEYSWKAMHDGNYLYLLVLGEGRNGQSPIGDSAPDEWNDDSIDIFWDSDNSKLSDYDGVNDAHVLLPLLKFDGTANRSGELDSRFFTGFHSVEVAESSVEFATCLCPGAQSIWEVRVDLVANQMVTDTVIGFEIQLGDDKDGGERDAKWGWFHPSRTSVDVDNTWQNPNFMSTIRLVPSLF